MAQSRARGNARTLRSPPALLAREQRNRRPVVGNERMQEADRRHGEDKERRCAHLRNGGQTEESATRGNVTVGA